MSVSMYWLSERLAECPDAAGLEYGCVDWFRYDESATLPQRVGERPPIAPRPNRSRLRCRVAARSSALKASRLTAGQSADTR